MLNVLTEDTALAARASDKIKLGIIGAGRLSSSRIYPCLHMLPVDLVGVCDLDRAKAEINAQKFGARAVYADHREMLKKADLDAVVICVGPEVHHKLAIDVMEAGLHVYTEKPPGVTVEHAQSMLAASRRLNRICMTGFKKRFAPAYAKAKAAIASPAFGAPTLLSIDYCCGPTYANNPQDPRSVFLLDFCIHVMDLALFLFGDVDEVFSRTRQDLSYAVNLQFSNGAIGVLALSANRNWDVPTEKVELTGGPGQFISIDNSVDLVRHNGRDIAEWHRPTFSTARGDSLIETGFAGELFEFVAAIKENRQPESSIAQSLATMRLYEAIAQSARSGGVVRIEPSREGLA